MKKKFVSKKKLIFRYFNIRNFKISKSRSFYIWSFDILYPTRKFPIQKIPKISNLENRKI